MIDVFCDCGTDQGYKQIHLGRARRMSRERAADAGYHWQVLGRHTCETQLVGNHKLSVEEWLATAPADIRTQFAITCPRCKQDFRARAEKLTPILDRFEAADVCELPLHTLDVAYSRYSGEVVA